MSEILFMRKYLLLATALAVAVLMSNASSARADFLMRVSEDGASFVTIGTTTDFGSMSANGYVHVVAGATVFSASSTGGDIHLQGLSSTSDNAATGSDLFTSELKITELSGSTHKLVFQVTQSNYTLPGAIGSNLTMLSSGSGTRTTAGTGTTGSTGFQSFASNSNGDYAMVGATSPGPQTLNLPASTNDSTSSTAFFARTSAMYSVTSSVNYTLNGGEALQTDTSVLLTVPAPAGLPLLLSGLPVLGIGGWLRRRATKA
jgi:hypothetical protein